MQTASIESRASAFIAASCISLFIPAAWTIVRPGRAITLTEHVPEILRGIFALPVLLFEAVADHMGSSLTAAKVNRYAQRCADIRQGAAVIQTNLRPRQASLPAQFRLFYKRYFRRYPDFWDLQLTIDGQIKECHFERWTRLHAQFARDGGIQLRTDNNPETISLTTQNILDLLKRHNRFDLLEHVTKAKIVQRIDKPAILDLSLLRLLLFLYYIIRRVTSGLQLSEIEVAATGHIFLTLCIQVFWWDKARSIRAGIMLDRQKVVAIYPSLRREVEVDAPDNAVDAFPAALQRQFGLFRWSPGIDNGINLRIDASVRNIVVFGLSTMHAVVMILLQWRLQSFSFLWYGPIILSMCISGIILGLSILDILGRCLSISSVRFGTLWGAEIDWGQSWSAGAASMVRTKVHGVLDKLAYVNTVLTSVTILSGLLKVFLDPSDGVLVAGPGDLLRPNATIF